MADRTTGELPAVEIGELPLAPDIYDDTLLPVEQQGEAKHITGRQWKDYAVAAGKGLEASAAESAKQAADSAKQAAGSAEAAAGSAKEAESSADKAEHYSGKPPIIQGDTETWWTWDAEQQAYQDTGKPSRGNLLYACFEVDPATGDLFMFTDSDYMGPQFALTGPDLEVILNHA